MTPLSAHPRACGENTAFSPSTKSQTGSSPRVRGKLPPRARGWFRGGLIPARAGKTGQADRDFLHSGAHPRACGENSMLPGANCSYQGSSPRVRGKLNRLTDVQDTFRLIPARAGKTLPRWHRRRAGPAHPRACGENDRCVIHSTAQVGSSPRVRGKH